MMGHCNVFLVRTWEEHDNFTTQQSRTLTLKRVHGLSEWPNAICFYSQDRSEGCRMTTLSISFYIRCKWVRSTQQCLFHLTPRHFCLRSQPTLASFWSTAYEYSLRREYRDVFVCNWFKSLWSGCLYVIKRGGSCGFFLFGLKCCFLFSLARWKGC